MFIFFNAVSLMHLFSSRFHEAPNLCMPDSFEISPPVLEKFVAEIIQHEKRYAHSERGLKQERRSKVQEKIEETAVRELDNA